LEKLLKLLTEIAEIEFELHGLQEENEPEKLCEKENEQ
jgi:hypothetical protein